MTHCSCCVVNCKNTSRNSKCKFYKFPSASWKLEQRKKWITAVRRINDDGSPWSPKPYDHICSGHFVGGQKSEELLSPSWTPTIFPTAYRAKQVNKAAIISRHKRFMERRLRQQPTPSTSIENSQEDMIEVITDNIHTESSQNNQEILTIDKQCQTDIFSQNFSEEKILICNKYEYIYPHKTVCHAETQTEIGEIGKIIRVKNQKQLKDKKCGPSEKTYVDQYTEPDCNEPSDLHSTRTTCSDSVIHNFAGISSVRNNEQLIDLAGISINNFKFLLKRMDTLDIDEDKCKITMENRLLIFLIQMKTGLSFSAISVLFDVHRTTISRIFYSILRHLAGATANLVFWPNKDTVQGTMPECFQPDYTDTRVIIDCTEFRIEVPAGIDKRVFCYSHYKKGFTAKVLIGITPGGFICFKSKVAGGRKSDSQITIESGLIDYLEDGDVVLADKGFPEIRTTIDESGKEVRIVMPPFLQRKSEFTKEETEETYNIARIRIHVERIMQRLRIYKILDKIPENLFHCIDDIVHMCCVLVNLQPPIFSNKEQENKNE